MLFKFKKLAMCAAVSMTLASTISGCSNEANTKLINTDVESDGATRPNVKTYATQLNVSVVDALTGAPIENSELSITKGAESLTAKEYDASLGLAVFNFKDTATPSNTNNITVAVKASAENYMTSSKSWTFDTAEAVSLVIKLLSLDDNSQPEGVGLVTKTINLSSVGDEGISITTPAASDGAASKIEIPKSIEMYAKGKTDAEGEVGVGNKITGGVELVVAHYEAERTEALEAFPGGFAVAVENPAVVNSSEGAGSLGDDGQLTFMSAGFVSVEIVDQDTREKVKSFNSPNCSDGSGGTSVDISGCVSVTMTIPKTTINPLTGSVVKEADKIPIWSFDVETGLWTYEAFSTEYAGITSSGENWLVKYPVTHLSYWNLDFFTSGDGVCNGELSILDASSTYPNRAKVTLSVSGYSQTYDYDGSGNIKFYNAPAKVDLKVKFSSDYDGEEFHVSDTIKDICASDLTSITVTPPIETIQSNNITLEASAYCNDVDNADIEELSNASYSLFNVTSKTMVERGSTDAEGKVLLENIISSVTKSEATTLPQYRLSVINPNTGKSIVQNFTLDDGDVIKTFSFGEKCNTTSTGSTTGSTGGSSGN